MTTWENGRRQVGPFTIHVYAWRSGFRWDAYGPGSGESADGAQLPTEAEAMAAADAWALEAARAMADAMGVSDGPE